VAPSAGLARRAFAAEAKIGALVIGLVAVAMLLQLRIDQERGARVLPMFVHHNPGGAEAELIKHQNFSLYLPKAQALRYASLGHRNIVADMVWLKAAHYASKQFAGGGRLDWLSKMYNVTVDLDPNWENAYWMGAMILASVARKPKDAELLLVKGMSRIPHSYKLPYEAGVTLLFQRGKEKDAAKYFRRAALHPECPRIVLDIIPRLLSEGGSLEAAIMAAESRLNSMPRNSVQYKATARDLMEFRSRLLVKRWQEIVEAFRRQVGRSPAALAEVRSPLPRKDSYGRDLLYDPASAKVDSEGLRLVRLNEQIAVMNAALGDVKHRLGRKPNGPREFLDEIRKIYKPRAHTDERGNEQLERVMGRWPFRFPAHPFGDHGERFRYSREKAEFLLRPDRRLDALYPEELR